MEPNLASPKPQETGITNEPVTNAATQANPTKPKRVLNSQIIVGTIVLSAIIYLVQVFVLNNAFHGSGLNEIFGNLPGLYTCSGFFCWPSPTMAFYILGCIFLILGLLSMWPYIKQK